MQQFAHSTTFCGVARAFLVVGAVRGAYQARKGEIFLGKAVHAVLKPVFALGNGAVCGKKQLARVFAASLYMTRQVGKHGKTFFPQRVGQTVCKVVFIAGTAAAFFAEGKHILSDLFGNAFLLQLRILFADGKKHSRKRRKRRRQL